MARSLKKGPYVFDRLLKKVEELNHPDFMYWEETHQWKLKLQLLPQL